jgi:hypothetical protein
MAENSAVGSKLDLASLRRVVDKELHRINPLARSQLLLTDQVLVEAEQAETLRGSKDHLITEEVIDQLPELARKACRALLGAEDLGATLNQSWRGKPPDVAALHRRLVDVNGGSPKLAVHLRSALGAKADSAGQPNLVRQIRDLKLDAEVPVVQRNASQRFPPLLTPEAPPGTRPGQRESVRKGLAAPDEEAAAEVENLRTKAGREVDQFIEFRIAMLHASCHLARLLSETDEDRKRQQTPRDSSPKSLHKVPPDEDRKRQRTPRVSLTEVSQELGRPLRASERLLVANMHGRSVADIVKILANPD